MDFCLQHVDGLVTFFGSKSARCGHEAWKEGRKEGSREVRKEGRNE